jgi:Mrp family chromosome partitioning ATPase
MDHEPRDETEVHVDDEASGDDSMALGDPMAFGDGPTALAGEATRAAHRRARTIAVGGAKGGAGASVVAANLALYLASIGRRVLLVDAAPGGSSLHTLLGAPSPTRPRAVVHPNEPQPTAIQGLQLLWAALDEGLTGRRRGGRAALARAVVAATSASSALPPNSDQEAMTPTVQFF